MDYLTLKYIHIVSSAILFGTGVGSAFYFFMANRRKDIAEISFTTRLVVFADWLFTSPSVIIQLITGITLMQMRGYGFADLWIKFGLVLYLFAGLCWLPIVWLQIKMRDMARDAMDNNASLPQRYWVYEKWWVTLGSLGFPAVLVVFYFMVFKPI